MYKLRQIEINGFKSFHDKAKINFPGRIVAVVGPNGCGKSNICDAVTWVLGEQSAKSLRSQRMDDVIFNGSLRKRPLGLAEVALTLETDTAEAPNTDGLLTITRRVYREGEAEYRINGERARLRDIQDILMGTGLGLKEYSVIQQGKIDLILSARPQDRRKLLEEAAGITKYKLRKRAAEVKLEETNQNLQRIADLLAEIERQCNSLKRQSTKAERWKAVDAELRGVREKLYALEFRHSHAALTELAQSRDQAAMREGDRSAAVGAGEVAITSLRQELEEALAELASRREQAQALKGSVSTREETDRALAARIAEADDRSAQLEAKNRGLDGDEQNVAQDLGRVGGELQAEKDRAGVLRNELHEVESQRQQAEARVRALDEELERSRSELLRAIGRAGQQRNSAHSIDIGAEKAKFQLQKLTESEARLDGIRRDRQAELAILQEAAEALRGSVAEVGGRLDAAFREREQLVQEEKSLREQAAKARSEAWAAGHKIESLGLLLARKEKPFRQQAEAFERAGSATAGLLSEHIDAEPGSESLIDAALGELAEIPVVRDGGRAAELIAQVQSEKSTRLRFFALDQSLTLAPAGDESSLRAAGATPLAERARLRDQAATGIAQAIASCWLAPDLATAAMLARQRPDLVFLTPDRHRVHGAIFEAPGPDDSDGPLTLRREIHELEIQRDRHAAEADALGRRADEIAPRLPELEVVIQGESARKTTLAQEWSVNEADRRRAGEERERAEREIDVVQRERGVFDQELHRLEATRGEVANEIRELDRQQELLEGRIAERQDELAKAREESIPIQARAAALRTEAGVAAERIAGLERDERAIRHRGAEIARQRQDIERERGLLADTRVQAQAQREATLAGLRQDLAELEKLGREIAADEAAAGERRENLVRREDELQALRGELDDVRNSRHRLELEEAGARAALATLVERSERELQTNPSELADPGEVSEEEKAALAASATELGARIESMGTVNLLALEELEEADTRRNFLRTQHDDLVASIANLRNTIKTINKTSTERFVETFGIVNDHFRNLFQELFSGGTAEMRLIDENDPLESGIEITARPPGKNNQSIQLLSGGEKALTAIALLMAIFRYKPSPFCILDEVDAPLDEPNIDRFGKILQTMADETQFIVITHSKRTMEMADVLYGVTMEEAGCSKLVSVKLTN